MTGVNAYLVAYDIALPKRWRRVTRVLSKWGDRVQLSVYVGYATPAKAARLEGALRDLIDNEADRLMVINLGPGCCVNQRVIGRAIDMSPPDALIV